MLTLCVGLELMRAFSAISPCFYSTTYFTGLFKNLLAIKNKWILSKWSLSVNVTKTKIVIFSRGKVQKYPRFTLGSNEIEVKDDYVYLGVTFNYNGSFKNAISKQISQGRKAMFALIEKAKIWRLPTDILLELLETCVMPVLLYATEIWDWENLNDIEIFHRDFLENLLKTFKFTQTVCYMEERVLLTFQQKSTPE